MNFTQSVLQMEKYIIHTYITHEIKLNFHYQIFASVVFLLNYNYTLFYCLGMFNILTLIITMLQ